MSRLSFIIFCLCGARAWHTTGHFIITTIAQKEIENARPKLLPKLEKVIKEYSEFTKEHEHPFVEASSFPDDIKYLNWKTFNKWHFNDDYIFANEKAKAKENEKKKKADSEDEDEAGELYRNKQNIIFAINEAKRVIQSPKESQINPIFGKSMMLRYLIHLIGDLHQPLHATSLVNEAHPKGDAGGNAFEIKMPGAKDLHSYWDKTLKIYKDIRAPIEPDHWRDLQDIAADLTKRYPRSAVQARLDIKSLVNWSRESRDFALQAYKPLKEKEAVPSDYAAKMKPIVDEQLVVGGYRLADFIMDMLKDESVLEKKAVDKPVDDMVLDSKLPNPFDVEETLHKSANKESQAEPDTKRERTFEEDLTPEEIRANEEAEEKNLVFKKNIVNDQEASKFYKKWWFFVLIFGFSLLTGVGLLLMIRKRRAAAAESQSPTATLTN